MAIAANTLLEYYSSDELIELRRLVLLYNLTTRQHVGQFEAGTAAKEYAISASPIRPRPTAAETPTGVPPSTAPPRASRSTAPAARRPLCS